VKQLIRDVDALRRGLRLRGGQVVCPRPARRWQGLEAEPGLAELLYERVFIDWQPGAADGFGEGPAFLAELRERVRGASYLEGGFRVTQREAQGAFVQSDAIRLWVTQEEALAPRRARVGRAVKVRLPCAREAAVPGFFTVVSRKGRLKPDAPYIRAYVNVWPQGALGLVEALVTDRFIKSARFEAQVVNAPSGYGRRDTALVFVHPPDWRRVVWWLRAMHRYEPSWFREATPPMTLPVLPGISAAESRPSEHDVFGAYRCRLLARALLESLRSGTPWATHARAVFAAEGLDFAAPWLGALGEGWTRA